jgi:hypothetical protein
MKEKILNWIKTIAIIAIFCVSYMVSKELFAFYVISAVAYVVITFQLYWLSRQGLPRNRRLVTECPFKYGMVTRRGSRPKSVITGGRVKYDEDFLLVNSKGEHIKLDATNGNIVEVDSFIKNQSANKSGISLVGIPFVDRIEVFHFNWNDLVEKTENGKITTQHLEQKDLETEYFSVLKTFGFIADSLEIGLDRDKKSEEGSDVLDKLKLVSSQVTVDMTFALTVLIVDVMKAICTLNWYKGLQGIIRQRCLEYCGDHSLDSIINDSGKDLNEFIIKLNDEILDKFGVAILKSSYNGYVFSGTEEQRKKIEESAQMIWLADQTRQANQKATDAITYGIRETAKAKADEIREIANANAARIELEGAATTIAQGSLFEKLGHNAQSYAIATTKVQTLVIGADHVGINIPTSPNITKIEDDVTPPKDGPVVIKQPTVPSFKKTKKTGGEK